jgi:isoaspartyl peptidase/L-asparaginase-like protein (Ntn-hydrolase superfamily)
MTRDVGSISSSAIVCHGGAGHGAKDQPGVDAAVEAGWEKLQSGSSAIDAAIAAILIMEDDPVLNAGTGGRIRADGSVQLDAALMTSDGRYGAVTCIEYTKNPILVAAKLLDKKINMLAGRGARDFADSIGVPRIAVKGSEKPSGNDTVGAIVRDSTGLIVVASSTGGCTGRPAGRVGDTPLIGAGLWCDENIGVAATGIGEAITLKMSSIRIADKFSNCNEIQVALEWGVSQFKSDIEVGFIALAKDGEGVGAANTAMPWSTMT